MHFNKKPHNDLNTNINNSAQNIVYEYDDNSNEVFSFNLFDNCGISWLTDQKLMSIYKYWIW
ncbi:hypothetical protein UUR10_0518 [Ureaplasma urealyticum serovar 10 str. ATCC 33699]|uniref:Uncharacterized protein n=2 Tax=Ureaplasma urealyticum TaxID=2130 RepID=A0ABM9XJ77_UREUR|nr:hypothetical protein [Ureaplasma urealyticum]ACI60319.1 hypothetical protein UUR10_0518 [Ureaplasma urealyticum serovar 10 str. ATCC 33699]EDU57226.1 conserved hypothetical protein [Ureaplasma urealyticum serovar 7 str. ATCC 27819]EDU67130.1 conserved hypothetical protein [Ureaplasma urealyticum serovar 11 str. ATCC 33695]EDX53743.1 hypothetical protein UUR9_0476 [Ureaplasma urealyticum serovar 9 str. ATCC 33175]EEH01203.1 hypothetical protein UUR8_0521 [Ureaplasma urealyticum serovar 8 str